MGTDQRYRRVFQLRGAVEPRLFATWEVGGRVWRAKGPSAAWPGSGRCLDGVWLVTSCEAIITHCVGGWSPGQGDVGLGDAIRKDHSSTLHTSCMR